MLLSLLLQLVLAGCDLRCCCPHQLCSMLLVKEQLLLKGCNVLFMRDL